MRNRLARRTFLPGGSLTSVVYVLVVIVLKLLCKRETEVEAVGIFVGIRRVEAVDSSGGGMAIVSRTAPGTPPVGAGSPRPSKRMIWPSCILAGTGMVV